MSERRIHARYVPTAVVHLVGAAGGPDDGSLAGFNTYCGLTIEDPAPWQEGDFEPTCSVCLAGPGVHVEGSL